MTKVQLRNAWFQVHKWIGILLAIVLIPLSVTGSMLVWDDALDRMLEPTHYAALGPAKLPVSSYVETARRALPPGSAIQSVRIGDGPVMVTATAATPGAMRGPPIRLAAWVDPQTGRLIDSGLSVSPLMRWAHIFHGSLQIPGVGRAIVGWLGVAMLLSSLTGLWLWWPLTGRWTRGVRWKRQPDFNANLHHQVGFWISLPLAILSLTGVIIAWPQMMGSSRNTIRRPMQTPLAAPHLGIDQALGAAPAKGHVTITSPTNKDPSWKIAAGGAPAMQVDDATGRVSRAKPDDRQRARPLSRRLHDGSNMGLIWQIIIFLGGLAPAALGVTGILMWLRARVWRGEVARRKAAAVTAG
jgi:uncharacterized iron-regulated membrane protein